MNKMKKYIEPEVTVMAMALESGPICQSFSAAFTEILTEDPEEEI